MAADLVGAVGCRVFCVVVVARRLRLGGRGERRQAVPGYGGEREAVGGKEEGEEQEEEQQVRMTESHCVIVVIVWEIAGRALSDGRVQAGPR